MYFVSKKDFTYFALIWGTLAFLSIITIYGWISDNGHIITDLLLILTILYLLIGWFRTGYRVENDIIKIQSGLFSTKVKLKEINKITKEKSIMAGPTLATDRLVLHVRNYKQIQISPKDENHFLELLMSKNSNIELEGKLLKST